MARRIDDQHVRDVILGLATRLYNAGNPTTDQIESEVRRWADPLGVKVDRSTILSVAAEAYNTLVSEGSKPAGTEITGDVITGETGDVQRSRLLIEGVFRRSADTSSEDDTGPTEIPFSIDTDLFLTPFELLEILENSEVGDVRSMLDDSPGLRKRLETLEFERLSLNPGDWEAAVIEIIDRVNEKQLGG